MNKNNGSKPAAKGKGSNALGIGILAGMLIGASLAAGVVWYLKRAPSPFIKSDQAPLEKPSDFAKLPTAPEKPAAPSDEKQHFEFYKMLTDKQKAPAVPQNQAVSSAPAKAPAAFEPQILQAGSFPNAGDAENLKAKLALLGVEAKIQTAKIQDKGVWYRVRLGPYKNANDLNHARSFLKQNGMDSTPMRAQ